MRISDWSSDVCSSDLGDLSEGVFPVCFNQLAALADIGFVQTATNESVDGVTRLVGRPFLVHILIDPGKRTQHLTPSAIETNIGYHRIHDVDSEGFSQFPGTRRTEEHTSEFQSLMRHSYAAFSLKKKNTQ